MSASKGGRDEAVGYGKPPPATRFQKGRSGNPRGRPRNAKYELPHEAMLGQMVTVREQGGERRVEAGTAFLMHLTQKGLAGDGRSGRAAMAMLEEARALHLLQAERGHGTVIEVTFVDPGSVNMALEPLRMAKKLDRHRPTARMMLEPWMVEAALSRFGSRRLSLEEQRTIIDATRSPQKVEWPSWWKVRA